MQATFNGDGIINGLQAIGTSDGQVKGKVGNSLADPPLRPDGKLNVGAAIGKGRGSCPFRASSYQFFLLNRQAHPTTHLYAILT